MYNEVILSRFNALGSKKKMLSSVFNMICGSDFGKMKYIQIDGLGLESVKNKCIGTNERLYLESLVDAISILEGINSEERVVLCNKDHTFYTKNFGIKSDNLGFAEKVEDILCSWGELEDEDIGYEESDYDNDEDEYDDGVEGEGDTDDNDGYAGDSDEDDVGDEVGSEEDGDEEDGDEEEDEEDGDEEVVTDESEEVLRKCLSRTFSSTISLLINKVMSRYDLLFESGYDLNRPYGLVTATDIIYTDSSKNLKIRESDEDLDLNSIMNLSKLLMKKIGYLEQEDRHYGDISTSVYNGYKSGKRLLFFPHKLLEYAYGRSPLKSKSGNVNVYNYPQEGVSTNWKKFKVLVRKDVELTIQDCLVLYSINELGVKLSDDKATVLDILMRNVNDCSAYIGYISDCLSTCVLMIEYKSCDHLPVKYKLRVCDPTNSLDDKISDEIISEVFSGNTGGSNGSPIKNGLNPSDSKVYMVFEYGHEFNHSLSNAMPLFAYKAYESLKAKGEKVDYKSLILGQGEDGTIMRNGTHGLKLSQKLFHYINAGSRSGKGVMTLNMLAGALVSGKAIIYLDNKPDMVSVLSELSGGVSGGNEFGPPMFGLNGGNYIDDKQKQFVNQDNWINRSNIPIEAVKLFGEPRWSTYGEIFYMRAFMLAFGIILARGLDGGHGKMNDPRYNGKDGIFLVCDETNVLQENFKVICGILADKIPLQSKKFTSMSESLIALYNEANSDAARKGTDLKYANAKRDFEGAFNAHKFYALSYLKSLADDIAYIYQKSLAGFLTAEAGNSDVIIIGQNLEQIAISKDVITSAVSSGRLSGEGSGTNGLGGTQIAKDIKGFKSIPLAHFVFSSADALIGYNSLHPEYLAQTDETSKAFGKLDLVSNNFCYIPDFKLGESDVDVPGKQLTKVVANSPSSVYFKPYLILNDCTTEYTDQLYDRVTKAGISSESVIQEYPNEDGTDINPCIGFKNYMALMGVSDIPDRLKKGADIADMVVREVLGYQDDGSGRPLWLQFVTDLRPEWLLSIRDIATMCGGLDKDANMTKKVNPITDEYYNYIKFIQENSNLGIVDTFMSSFNSTYVDENGAVQYDMSGYESNGRAEFLADDDYSSPREEQVAEGRRFEAIFQDNVGTGDEDFDNEGIDSDDMFESAGSDWNKKGGSGSTFNGINENEISPNNMRNTEKSKEVNESDIFISKLISAMLSKGFTMEDIYSMKPEGVGVDVGYDCPDSYVEVSNTDIDGIDFNELDEELTANSFASLIYLITDKVITNFGGYSRIHSLRVVGGSLVINGSVFRCKLSKECIGKLPLDIRRKVNTGNVADLFNYNEMRRMPNLREIVFDSDDFVYDVVRVSMGYRGDSLNLPLFFSDIPSLQVIKIGKSSFNRGMKVKDYESSLGYDLYYHSRVTNYAKVCDGALSKLSKRSWSFTKNMFNSRNHGFVVKTFGVILGGTSSVVTGVASLGSKAVGTVSKKIDKRRSEKGGKVKSGLSAFKEGFSSLFKD